MNAIKFPSILSNKTDKKAFVCTQAYKITVFMYSCKTTASSITLGWVTPKKKEKGPWPQFCLKCLFSCCRMMGLWFVTNVHFTVHHMTVREHTSCCVESQVYCSGKNSFTSVMSAVNMTMSLCDMWPSEAEQISPTLCSSLSISLRFSFIPQSVTPHIPLFTTSATHWLKQLCGDAHQALCHRAR